jgi:hypothetical protein
VSSTDDATKLRDTVSTGEFRALFIPAAKTYGEACFGVQLMQVCALLYGTYVLTWAVLQDDAFVAVFVDMLDYVITNSQVKSSPLTTRALFALSKHASSRGRRASTSSDMSASSLSQNTLSLSRVSTPVPLSFTLYRTWSLLCIFAYCAPLQRD